MDTKKNAAKAATVKDESASQGAKQKPAETIREGDCSASIWARHVVVQGQPKTFYSVTLERSYKDRDGAWKYAKSFDADSLGRVASLCTQATKVIRDLEEEEAVK
jgi:hypothetical protein